MEQTEKLEQLTFEGMPMSSKGQQITILKVPLNKIKLGRNSRAKIDKDELEGLMESIKSIGLLQPIGLAKEGSNYTIAYGNRRFLACSKLGLSHIPAIVHSNQKASEIDIKNLAENVQRKNVSLMEVGRYVGLLKKEGMTGGEISVRLGVPRYYVETAERCFASVPSEFRNSVSNVAQGKKAEAGKIAPQTAMKILNASRTYRLDRKDEKSLFEEARSNAKFEPNMVNKYAMQLKSGETDFVKNIKPMKHIRIQFMISQDDYDKLQAKHVDDGPFSSVTAAFKAAIVGKISLAGIKILEDK